jgi:branched-chain amino acid transport system substrate-binding protein
VDSPQVPPVPRALPVARRSFLRLAGLAGAGAVLGGTLSGCGLLPGRAKPSGRVVKLGYVAALSGPLAAFGEADTFNLNRLRELFAKQGIAVGERTHPVEIVVKDAQSGLQRAATVTKDLLTEDKVDLVLASGSPEISNPVAATCEQAGVPCISTMTPLEVWAPLGHPSTAAAPYEFLHHFFFAAADQNTVFIDLWSQVATNQVVGRLWPATKAADYFVSDRTGPAAAAGERGFSFVMPGRYRERGSDFGAQIDAFRKAGAEIVEGGMIAPDFATFWKEANDAGYRPRIATIGKALYFPPYMEAMAPAATGVSTVLPWHPAYPDRSTLTGETGTELAAAYTKATAKQWVFPLGFVHALFEVAADALGRSGDPGDRAAVAAAVAKTDLRTVVGRIDFQGGPAPNLARVAPVGGQWRRTSDPQYPYELVVVSNTLNPEVPVRDRLRAIPALTG